MPLTGVITRFDDGAAHGFVAADESCPVAVQCRLQGVTLFFPRSAVAKGMLAAGGPRVGDRVTFELVPTRGRSRGSLVAGRLRPAPADEQATGGEGEAAAPTVAGQRSSALAKDNARLRTEQAQLRRDVAALQERIRRTEAAGVEQREQRLKDLDCLRQLSRSLRALGDEGAAAALMPDRARAAAMLANVFRFLTATKGIQLKDAGSSKFALNPHAFDPAAPVHQRFVAMLRRDGIAGSLEEFWESDARSAAGSEGEGSAAETRIGFHGTKQDDWLHEILRAGFDSSKRAGQSYGPGEYFDVDMVYSPGYGAPIGNVVIVTLVVAPATAIKESGNILVVNNPLAPTPGAGVEGPPVLPTYCLPLGAYGPHAALTRLGLLPAASRPRAAPRPSRCEPIAAA